MKHYFRKYFNLTAKNISIIFIATFIVNIINFFYQIIMGRILGPSGYGELATLISLIFISGALTSAFQSSVARSATVYNVEKNNYKIKQFFILATIRFFILSCLIFILILLFLKPLTIFLKMESYLPLIILGIITVESSLSSVATGIVQGIGRFKALGLNIILSTALKLILGVILVYAGFYTFGAVLGIMLSTLIAYFILVLSIKDILRLDVRNINNELSEDNDIDLKGFYMGTTMVLISTIIFTIMSYIDIVLVKHLFSPTDTGYFAAASQIGKIILFFPSAIITVVFPKFTEKFEKNERLKNSFLKSFLILFLISAFFLIFYYFFPDIITKVIYGSVYEDSSKLIFLYGVFTTFISFINLQMYYFFSVKNYWYLIHFFIVIIIEIILIINYNKSILMILWIEIIASLIIFILNIINMFIISRRRYRLNNA